MYRWLDHTAEIELELEAQTERELLSDAVTALRELLEGEEPCGGSAATERRTVRAIGSDRPALLAAWLEELLFLSESEGFIPVGIEQLLLEDRALRSIVAGRMGEPRPLVKAVTYHRLQFEPFARGYRGRVVFDL